VAVTRQCYVPHLNKVTMRLPLPMGLPYRSRVKSSCESYDPSGLPYLSRKVHLEPFSNRYRLVGKTQWRASLSDRCQPGPDRQFAGDEVGTPCRATCLGIIVGEAHPLGRQSVEIRGPPGHGIQEHIGRRPIAAFGNSDGDLQMLQWTTAGKGARFASLVHHTDATREWAYDRERTTNRPLVWPTLERAFAFLALLIVLTTIEEAVVGLFHRQSIAASLGELFGPRLQETIAGFIIMLLVLIPYSAFMVLSEALGEGRLARMFFVERQPIKQR
jgi:hypothetical protein